MWPSDKSSVTVIIRSTSETAVQFVTRKKSGARLNDAAPRDGCWRVQRFFSTPPPICGAALPRSCSNPPAAAAATEAEAAEARVQPP